jgi:iron(III) transport system ATP-binding protein
MSDQKISERYSMTVQSPEVANAPMVKVESLVKHFRRSDGAVVTAVDDISLTVMPGQFTVLLGPSGCGKTTLLRCVAGLERPADGRISIRGRTVFDGAKKLNLAPEKRGLNMIFQSYALWPHMTAAANIAYPLACKKVDKREIPDRVARALTMVGIPELGKQRVALARALVSNSDLVLFDEPLSNVDAKVREQLRFELLAMQRELGFAALYVTHDQTEAMELANTVAVLERGKVAQEGTPQQIYREPRSRYVGSFIGTLNEVEGTLTSIEPDGTAIVSTALGTLRAGSLAPGVVVGDRVLAVCRPERVELSTTSPTAANRWQVTVQASVFSGSRTEHVVSFEGNDDFRIWRSDSHLFDSGSAAHVGIEVGDLRVLPHN